MQRPINPEIRHYEETVWMGMTLRQTIWAAVAVAAAVLAYFSGRELLGQETVSWICITAAAPFAGIGFFTYDGMSAGKFLNAWLRTAFLQSGPRLWKSENRFQVNDKENRKRRNNTDEIKRV